MTTDMPRPPPRNPNPSMSSSNPTPSAEPQTKTLDEPSTSAMGPPPPKNPTLPKPDELEQTLIDGQQAPLSNSPPKFDSEVIETATESSIPELSDSDNTKEHQPQNNVAVPYAIPPWSEPPCHRYFLEVLKDGSIVDQLDVYEKGAYMFGRVDLCDFVLDHPTISRFHAVIQFKRNGDAYLYDLGSTHGSSINKNQVKKKAYVDLHVGDVIRFGHSSRLYIFQGPSELMPPERDLKSIRSARMPEDMKDMEASLSRAKLEASLTDGISWGMGEGAEEEAELQISIMDIFDSSLNVEETHYKEGFDEGYSDGLVSGKDEGRQVGLKVGFEVGEEVGFYGGCVDVWNSAISVDSACFSSRIQKSIKQMDDLIRKYPIMDPENESVNEIMESLRLKFRAICATLNVKLEYSGYQKASDVKDTEF